MPPYTGSAVPETLRKGRFGFRGAARQRGLPGWAAGLLLWALISKSKAQSYPKAIFLPMDYVQQAPVCRAKQYVATSRLIQTDLRAGSPGEQTQPGRGCRTRSPAPRELSTALGSLLECKLGSCMIFTS